MTADRIPFESCPLCGSHDHVLHTTASCAHHPLFDAAISSTMQWRRCKSCTHIFTDGFFTAEALAVVFGKVNVAQMVGADMENQRAVSARMIEKKYYLFQRLDRGLMSDSEVRRCCSQRANTGSRRLAWICGRRTWGHF